MHNLLSQQAKQRLAREYIARVLTVGFLVGSTAVLIGAVSLLPSFLSNRFDLSAEQAEMARLAAAITIEEGDQKPFETLERGRNLMKLLQSHGSEEQYSMLLEEALHTRPAAVSLSSITFDRTARALQIQGVAATRDALVEFTRRLEADPRFAQVELPISDYARATDLRFRLTLTLATQR